MNRVKVRRYASPVWLGILATIAIVGLLLAFHHVVRGAVQQGELRRRATATHAEAAWRCNFLRELDSCLVQQNALPHDGAPLRARDVATGQQIRVKLVATDVERGFIDFVPID